ncbi:class I SAM-dependent methyltransferase [Leptolyngbya cf. ectocarpi LEGE 11479]|uniref:Class I SAM-dependent methyltransferase n=1 Tax=Leptolyngbya cf. ectocarpi LEGE 11479 TaxID=1828722 RepID=A0A928X218_LEPEC|nr:class I SAM-dependent methyltransferase [Leptolyngbya ectocarpi]MBE9065613.1 class I SAM-dependent methyltransferase [Leptolyngbya cf. ectocarpi LEGE 11479]
MVLTSLRRLIPLLFIVVCLGCAQTDIGTTNSIYSYKQPSIDGIGKVYMGREISQVMGHRGASWLERSSRATDEQPDMAVEALELRPTDTVADIGAGTGYMSFRMAQKVPEGQVLAVDLQPEMIALLETERDQQGLTNVQTIQADENNPHLPSEQVDLALMVDAYHEFEAPREVMTGVVKALRPGGRVVLAEYRAENPLIMIKRLHKMSEKQVKKEMAAVGLTWLKTDDRLPQQHLLFFEKAA